ncbi:hypothetical protein BJ875DRAFT_350310, partial [Amylocarpus encephaloides]
PWATEHALGEYWDCARILPNELVFINPRKSPLSFSSKRVFKTVPKSRWNRPGGIVREESPIRHRDIVKRIYPAFSKRSVKALEPVEHGHIDCFVKIMHRLGSTAKGI